LKPEEKFDPKKQTLARTFSYTTYALLIGAMLYLLTNNLIATTQRPDFFGTGALLGFGLVYWGISYLISKRYSRKQFIFERYPYVNGIIILIPAIGLIRAKGDIFTDPLAEGIFLIVLTIGVTLGAYYGIRKGKQMHKEEQEHAELSKRRL
jgi:FtsH-binding integral membrane protein